MPLKSKSKRSKLGGKPGGGKLGGVLLRGPGSHASAKLPPPPSNLSRDEDESGSSSSDGDSSSDNDSAYLDSDDEGSEGYCKGARTLWLVVGGAG